ncbi:MAG: hypothetical protein WCD31_08685 [Gillisia sp.]
MKKYNLLIKSITFDLIGMASYFIPFFGYFLDILWAPYAASAMRRMYPGKKGKLASVIVFIEEILPGTDIIPTFSLMWLYTFVWKKEKSVKEIIVEAS